MSPRAAVLAVILLQAGVAVGNPGLLGAKTCGVLFCAQDSVCCAEALVALCGPPGSTCCYTKGSATAKLCAPGLSCRKNGKDDGTCFNPNASHVHFDDKVEDAFRFAEEGVALLLHGFLISDWALYLSIFLILQWHIRFHFAEYLYTVCGMKRCWEFLCTCGGFCPGRLPRNLRLAAKPMLVWRKLGLNMLIFSIYYDPDLPEWIPDVRQRKFVVSAALILVDTFVIFYMFENIARAFTKKKAEDFIDPFDDLADDGIALEKYVASNVYEDLTHKTRRILPTWIIQIALILFYVRNLNMDQDTKDFRNVSMGSWVVAVIFSIYAGDGQVGEAFSSQYWENILARSAPGGLGDCIDEFILKESSWKGPSFFKVLVWADGPVLWWEWMLRCFMDVTVNSVARNLIIYTVPILVCVEEPLDFVKDLTAVMFICTLDDQDNKDITEIVVKLKFRQLWSQWEKARRALDTDISTQPLLAQPSLGPTVEWIEGLDADLKAQLALTQDELDFTDKSEESFESMVDEKSASGQVAKLWEHFRTWSGRELHPMGPRSSPQPVRTLREHRSPSSAPASFCRLGAPASGLGLTSSAPASF